MKLSLKRITSTGNFIPEIDGLRFVAIVSVLVYHLSGFLQEKDVTGYKKILQRKGISAIGHATMEEFKID